MFSVLTTQEQAIKSHCLVYRFLMYNIFIILIPVGTTSMKQYVGRLLFYQMLLLKNLVYRVLVVN